MPQWYLHKFVIANYRKTPTDTRYWIARGEVVEEGDTYIIIKDREGPVTVQKALATIEVIGGTRQ